MERYSKQVLFQHIGIAGQQKLKESRVMIVGCGALGTVIASNLVRSGVGYIKLVDRDYIELSNLQRQFLYDEEDIANNLPKAIAARNKLVKVNSDVVINDIVTDVNAVNIESMCGGIDLILDATDNFHTRYLINDISIKLKIPWIYGGVLGSTGMTYTIIPDETPCFRCIHPEMPAIGSVETCDTAGVLNTIVNIIASMQSTEAIKYLVGKKEDIIKKLRYMNIWSSNYQEIPVNHNEECKTCSNHKYEFSDNKQQEIVFMCGSNSIQVNPTSRDMSIHGILEKLDRNNLSYKKNSYYIKFIVEGVQITLFYDGRAIMKNITETDKAKSLYAKYIGL